MRSALEEQVQNNATQQSNTKDILELKPKGNATQRKTTVHWEDMWEVL